jgi:hypothetical protein
MMSRHVYITKELLLYCFSIVGLTNLRIVCWKLSEKDINRSKRIDNGDQPSFVAPEHRLDTFIGDAPCPLQTPRKTS